MTPSTLRFGFGKVFHLRKTFQFSGVKRGKRISTRYFILYAAKPREENSRLGVVASKKVGKAVRRNRCKRLVREVFRLQRPFFRFPLDLVVIVKSTPEAPTFKAYEQDLLSGLSVAFRSLA